MSQPHDGHRTFLPFGNPLRMIFPMGSYLSPKYAALLASFEKTLAENFKKLKPEDISDVFTLSWLRDAMTFLSETHISIQTFITDLEFPVSNWEEKWIDSYLDSSVKLLDVCIALNSELSRLDHGHLLLQYVLHVLQSPSNFPSSEQINRANSTLRDWIQQINSKNPKLADCKAILEGLAGTLYSVKAKNSMKGKVLMRALYGVKTVTIFVCSVCISVLSDCSKPLMTLAVPNKFLWVEAFNDLQADVLKEIMTRVSREKAISLKEFDAVQKCVEKLCALTDSKFCDNEISNTEDCNGHEGERWKEPVSELAEGSERFSLGLDLLSKQVGDFFQIVLTGRDALLCNLRTSDDVIMSDRNDVNESL